jgi:mannosyltransferase OCH1-like enzyme
MNLSQIYISTDRDLPMYLASCVATMKQAAGPLRHHVYGGTELRAFIAANFDRETVAAYDTLVPYSYKADLGRYCLLYALGGWYADIAVRANLPLPTLDGYDALVFRDAPHRLTSAWGCSTTLLFSEKGNAVYETAIRYVLRNCAEKYYGATPLCPTGPTLLGRAFASLGQNPKHLVGDVIALTPLHDAKNFAFVMPDGAILAFAKVTKGTPMGDGLASLGATGTNSYNELYEKGQIYAPDPH